MPDDTSRTISIDGSSRHSVRNRRVAKRLNAEGFATLLFDLLTMEEATDRANVFDIRLLADRLVAAYKEELQRALTQGFTDEEVAKAKVAFLESRFQQRSENGNLPGMLVLRADNGLTFQTWDGAIEAAVTKLTAADVNAAFKRHVRADKVAWVTAGDFEGAKKKAVAPKP